MLWVIKMTNRYWLYKVTKLENGLWEQEQSFFVTKTEKDANDILSRNTYGTFIPETQHACDLEEIANPDDIEDLNTLFYKELKLWSIQNEPSR